MLNKDFYPKEQLALNPNIDPSATYGAITSADLTSTAQPNLPPPPVPPAVDTVGGQTTIDAYNKMIADSSDSKTADTNSLTDIFNKYLSGSTPPSSQTEAY